MEAGVRYSAAGVVAEAHLATWTHSGKLLRDLPSPKRCGTRATITGSSSTAVLGSDGGRTAVWWVRVGDGGGAGLRRISEARSDHAHRSLPGSEALSPRRDRAPGGQVAWTPWVSDGFAAVPVRSTLHGCNTPLSAPCPPLPVAQNAHRTTQALSPVSGYLS